MPRFADPAITAVAGTDGSDLTELTTALASSAAESELGSTLGPWLLRRLLGRGGMGAVYLAERSEHDFQQRAALKLIKLGMDSGEILQRFLAERRILARLEHPNIARLIDGGVDHRGRPYFVMEWVDGLPLIDYANAHALDVHARIRLFLKLCDAVTHAHRQLVVHRDLKPGNILVDVRGEPKLLDFGIAKVLQADNTEDTSATGPRFFTRAYAAPEQIRGEPVTTATDIYALGAVLFEYLTGAALHSSRNTLTETRELLAQARKRSGSDGPAAITPRMLSGDLALVVAKAVRDEPSRRYASVEAFAEDLRAGMSGRPVRARPDSMAYRTGRFVRRHWLGVLASLAVLGAMVGGAGVALWQARIARAEALRAEAVSGFLSSVFESATPEGAAAGEITARALLQRGGERIERELADQPAVRARLYQTLGKAWFYIGDYSRAAEMYESGRALVAADDWRTSAALLSGLAQAELATGQVRLARTHVNLAFEQIDRGGPTHRLERAMVQSVHKSVLGAEGQSNAARDVARVVHEEFSRSLGPRAESSLLALNDLGTWTMEAGDAAASLPIFDRVIAQRREVSGPDHPEIATAMHNRHLALARLGRHNEALAEARAVVALRRRILPAQHRDLARSLGALADLESGRGLTRSAYTLREEALMMLRAQARPDQLLLGVQLSNQATDAFRLGDLTSARESLLEALQRLQPLLGEHDARVLSVFTYLGLVDIYRGDLVAAEQRLRATSAQENGQADFNVVQKLTTRRYLARALRWQGRPADALEVLLDTKPWLDEPRLTVTASARARLLLELALAHLEAGQLEPAQRYLQDLEAFGASAPASALDSAQISLAKARWHLAQDQWVEAQDLARAALDLLEQHLPDTHWDVAEARAVWSMAAYRARPNTSTRRALIQARDWHRQMRPWSVDTTRLNQLVP